MRGKSTFIPLPPDEQYPVIITRALPRKYQAHVIGTFPGGALRVSIVDGRTIKYLKLLPKSVTKIEGK